MASEKYSKIIIKKADLPPAGAANDFLVRFRIVSEDRNRFSQWSSLYKVDGENLVDVDGSINVIGSTVNAVWGDENNRPSYDVFVRFGDNSSTTKWQEWFYHGTSQIHTYSFLIPASIDVRTNPGVTPATYTSATPKKVEIRIQVEGTNHILSDALEIYTSPSPVNV